MNQRCIANETLGETGFHYTLSLINGKYKMTILYTRMEFGVVRFNEMKKYIGGISYKTLSASLKELEVDHAPRGVSADPAQGGIQPDRARKIPPPHPGRPVRMGRRAPAVSGQGDRGKNAPGPFFAISAQPLCALYASPQFRMASRMGSRLRPRSVRRYSTRGGTSA